MSEPMYAQCTMVRPLASGGVERHVAWIPSPLARVGRVVDIDINGERVPGYRIEAVGEKRPESFVVSRERDYAHQRKVSDI